MALFMFIKIRIVMLPLLELPDELLVSILERLEIEPLQAFAATSRRAHQWVYTYFAQKFSEPSSMRFFYRVFTRPALLKTVIQGVALIPWMQQVRAQPELYSLHKVELEEFTKKPGLLYAMLDHKQDTWDTGMALPWVEQSLEVQKEWLAQLSQEFKTWLPGVQLTQVGRICAQMRDLEPSMEAVKSLLQMMLARYTAADLTDVLQQTQTLAAAMQLFRQHYAVAVRARLQRALALAEVVPVPVDKAQFKRAVKRGDWLTVAQQVGSGALLDCPVPWIEVFKSEEWKRIIKILLLADVNLTAKVDKSTILHAVMRQGCLETLTALVAAGVDFNVWDDYRYTALTKHVQWPTCTVYLLEQGASVVDGEGRTILHSIAASGVDYPHIDAAWISRLITQYQVPVKAQDWRGETALHVALLSQKYELANILLDNGGSLAVISGLGHTPIHQLVNTPGIVEEAAVQFIKQRLEKDVSLLTVIDYKGNTLLHYTVHFNHRAVTQALLEKGASLLVRNGAGQTPMHLLPKNGAYPEIIAGYIAEKGDWNAVDSTGNSLLHQAVQVGDVSWVQFLIAHGAKPALRNAEGKVPLDLLPSLGTCPRRTNRQMSEKEYKQRVDLEMTQIRMQYYLSATPAPVLFTATRSSKRACVLVSLAHYQRRFMDCFQESTPRRESFWAGYAPGEGPCTPAVAEQYAKACVTQLEHEFKSAFLK